MKSVDCSTGLHDYCCSCDCVCHNKENLLTKEELKILYKWLEHQYLPYDNPELNEVVKKIQRIIDDMAR